MPSFKRPDPYDVSVLSYMSDVEILHKSLEFTFSMIYKTTAKFQPVVFFQISCTLLQKFRSLNINNSAIGLT